MRKILFIEEDTALRQIYAEIENRVTQARTTRPVWPCRMGCDVCCRRLAHPPEITAVEWHHLYVGIQTLPETVQTEIAQKIRAMANRDEVQDPFVTCPLLDEEVGACHVYEHRPAACRMYGFYVSRHNNQWCQQIEDLFQAGELEGAVLGNFTAMKRQIEQKLGNIRSIVDWWEDERPFPIS